jgi:hypothetical protein
MDGVMMIGANGPGFEFPDMRHPNDEVGLFLRTRLETNPCPQCGAVQIAGVARCYNGYSEIMKDHLPEEMPTELRPEIERRTSETRPNFPRILNRDLRPVIQNADIRSPRAGGSTVFITGSLMHATVISSF